VGRTERESRAGGTDRLAAIAAILREAAGRWGTPLYVTDLATLDAAGAELRDAFPDPWLRHYSVKANDVPAVIREVAAAADAGANVVSGGEWQLARRAGLGNGSITLEGVGKTATDLRAAVRAAAAGSPLRWVAVESEVEAEALAGMARRAGLGRRGLPPLDVLLRLNPSVAPETHGGLAVGAAGSKFGMTEAELSSALDIARAALGAVRARGIHLHVGSQLGAVDAWRDAVRRALATFALIGAREPAFDTLDVGGGFPVAAFGEPSPSPARFAQELPELLAAIPEDRRPTRLAVEPGRQLVARAGWLLGRVVHVRSRGDPQVILDVGMTELIRPALYGAHHPIVALTSDGRSVDAGRGPDAIPTDVHGPICESTDALGEQMLPPLSRGDLVAIRDAGAYAASMSSTYNGRARPPQVLIGRDGGVSLVRRRGTMAGLG
jgi:diaminopimelate decarboxylase